VDEQDDMAAVTRSELREELEKLEPRFEQIDQRFEQIDQRFEQIDQRFEQIDQRFEQIDQRFEQIDQRLEPLQGMEQRLEQRMDLWGHALRAELTRLFREQLVAIQQQLSIELARHSRANAEDLTKRIAAVDDKYRDLPPRVAALEAARPASRRRRRD
jgi:chromosome segregation ATPase